MDKLVLCHVKLTLLMKIRDKFVVTVYVFLSLLLLQTWLESVSTSASSELFQQSSLDLSDSQDTDIISESPPSKCQRLDTEAKHVRVGTQTPILYGDTLKVFPDKDGII